jgi:acyl CoA:acetate/3-ketoacid CoA transferase alpha subunit
MEEAIIADVTLVRAYKADIHGNLVFCGTVQNAIQTLPSVLALALQELKLS